ncbi:hypothetical protein TRVL_10058 [Trypanosoma vivax]|nr:hypothetical protein TRVL_10058 [Trypanosoma vivax]
MGGSFPFLSAHSAPILGLKWGANKSAVKRFAPGPCCCRSTFACVTNAGCHFKRLMRTNGGVSISFRAVSLRVCACVWFQCFLYLMPDFPRVGLAKIFLTFFIGSIISSLNK